MRRYIRTTLDQQRYPIRCPVCYIREEGAHGNISDTGRRIYPIDKWRYFLTAFVAIPRSLIEKLDLTDDEIFMYTELELAQFAVAVQCAKYMGPLFAH